jgi:hypothetical protein
MWCVYNAHAAAEFLNDAMCEKVWPMSASVPGMGHMLGCHRRPVNEVRLHADQIAGENLLRAAFLSAITRVY